MTIIWSPLAIQKVNEIAQYIAQDNYDAAIKWIDTIFEQVERLISFPQSGRIVPETIGSRSAKSFIKIIALFID